MIIKGNRHSNGAKLAAYLMNGGKHGERVEAPALRGFGSHDDDIFKAFRFLHVLAGGEIENPLFHVQVRLPEGEQITAEQWERTADQIEKRLGLTGQARAVVFHIDEQTGERHMHMAFSLIDEETLKAKELPFFKFRLKALARELEKEFDITLVKNEREGPINYAAKKNEQQQAQRLGTDKDEIRNTIRACWDQSDCGSSFEGALAHEGMILAQGDQRGLVVVDHAGGVHALGKRILDVNKKAILERLADLDINELPNVQQAQSLIREMKAEHTLEPQPHEKKQPNWNRDRANQAWEDAVINAAIEHEKTVRQFVDPKPEKLEPRAGSREKERQPPAKGPAADIWNGTRARNTKDNLLKSPAAVVKAASLPLNVIAKPLKLLENIFEGLFAPKLTPEQIREGEIAAAERQADVREQIDFSKYTADRAQEQRNHQEEQAARDRQREIERDR